MRPVSGIPHIVWPYLIDHTKHSIKNLAQQLHQLEQQSSKTIEQGQDLQLQKLLEYTYSHSPFFKQRLQQSDIHYLSQAPRKILHSLKPLTRRELQISGKSFFNQTVPEQHFPITSTQTSGSTGEPVTVKKTAINQVFWFANTLREHIWWQRDFSWVLAIIRANLNETQVRYSSWGPPVSYFANTGFAHVLSMNLDTSQQLDYLHRINPQYLLTYPSNLSDLIQTSQKNNQSLPRLRQVRTVGETVRDELKKNCQAIFNAPIVDTYSSQELGIIAIQCPVSDDYHVMAESLIVEVLDQQGEPCKAGEIGRLVITDLHNFASPLIRYEIGDYAQVGEPCRCGRGLPVLHKIIGRERNILHYPDGTRRWPKVGFDQFQSVAPILQYQLIQHQLNDIEVRLVAEKKLNRSEEKQLGTIIKTALQHPFPLRFTYYQDRIPRGKNNKFEEVICNISSQFTS